MNRQNWFEVKGDETLALDWPLDENSHVWEIGGYEGRWAQQIWDKFHCNITVFEPQDWCVEKLRNRFGEIDKIEIRPYGLWVNDASLPIGNFFTDGATIIPSMLKEPIAEGVFKNFHKELFGLSYKIDVGLMNIEGAEYRLLHEFCDSGVINNFKIIWVQFHPFDEADDTHLMIFKEMEQTHEMIWDCYPTAVAWRKK